MYSFWFVPILVCAHFGLYSIRYCPFWSRHLIYFLPPLKLVDNKYRALPIRHLLVMGQDTFQMGSPNTVPQKWPLAYEIFGPHWMSFS